MYVINWSLIRKMLLYLQVVCLCRKICACIFPVCYSGFTIERWVFLMFWQRNLSVFFLNRTHKPTSISYVYHVVITNSRKIECGTGLRSSGIICIWSIVETGKLVQHHSASPKWLTLCSDYTDSCKYHMSWSQRNINACASCKYSYF
jgi:hypothetical protein